MKTYRPYKCNWEYDYANGFTTLAEGLDVAVLSISGTNSNTVCHFWEEVWLDGRLVFEPRIIWSRMLRAFAT
jgi:hypothetical protein